MAQSQLEWGRKACDTDTDDSGDDDTKDSSDDDFYPGNYTVYGVMGKWQKQGYIPVPINRSSTYDTTKGIKIGKVVGTKTIIAPSSNAIQSSKTSGFTDKNKELFEKQIHLNENERTDISFRSSNDTNSEMLREGDIGSGSRRNKAFKMKFTRRRSQNPEEYGDDENTWSVTTPETTDREIMHREYVDDLMGNSSMSYTTNQFDASHTANQSSVSHTENGLFSSYTADQHGVPHTAKELRSASHFDVLRNSTNFDESCNVTQFDATRNATQSCVSHAAGDRSSVIHREIGIVSDGLQSCHQNPYNTMLSLFGADMANSISSVTGTLSADSQGYNMNTDFNPEVNDAEVAESAMTYLKNIESAVSQLNPTLPVTLNVARNKKKPSNSKKQVKKEPIYKVVRGEKWRECEKCGHMTKTRKAMREHNKIHRKEDELNDPDLKIIDGKRWRECSVCKKLFHTRKELRIHFRTHTNEKPYECSVCGKGFKQLAHMNSHMKIHSGEKPHTCDLCGMNFTERSSLKRHIRRHLGIKPFKCTLCSNEYYTSTLLKAHMESHLIKKGEMERFECEICHKSYSRKETLNAHLKTHDPDLQIRCDTCDMVFLTQSHLRRHQSKHCDKLEDTFLCGVCNRKFDNAYNLQKHMKRHTQPVKKFRCDTCNSEFADKCSLHRHMLAHDPNKEEKRKFECKFCSKAFFRRGNLTEHMRSHSDDRPYTCEICQKTFKRPWQYKVHLKNHQEKTYKCDLCPSSYTFKKSLQRHIQIHHDTECKDKDKPRFSCAQCPKTFILASSLRSHVKIHSEHALKCDVCDKLFFCKSSLSRHKMSHTKEKSNKCHLCDKSFKFLTSYRKHLVRTHKIEPRTARSYKCPHCQNLFSMKDSFLTHLKFYHGFVENNVSEICAESTGDSKNESSEAGVGFPVTKSSNESEEIISKKEQSACALGDDVVKEDALRFAENEHALFKSLKREPDLETDEGDSEYDLQLENKDSRGYFRVKNIKDEKEDDFAPMYKIQGINDSLKITQDTASVHDGKADDQSSETTILDNDSPRWTQDVLDNDSPQWIRNMSENDSPRRTQHIFNNDSPRQTHDNQTTILHVDHDSPGRTPEDIPIIVYEETDTDIDDSDVTEP